MKCVIIAGGAVSDYDLLLSRCVGADLIICADAGIMHADKMNFAPDIWVGDFDSSCPHGFCAKRQIRLPREKDDTDTFFAVKTAVSRGFADFLLLGVIGGRLDHTLANVSALLWLHRQGKTALAVDDHSEMEIVSRKPADIPDRFRFFSLLPLAGRAEGVTVKNAKYPLENAAIGCDEPYGVSNEPLPGKTAQVRCLDNGEVGFGSTEYIVFRAKEGTDPDYLYYLICSPLVRDPAIKSMVGSSGRQRVQTDVVANLQIAVPDFDEQKNIGGLLKLLSLGAGCLAPHLLQKTAESSSSSPQLTHFALPSLFELLIFG